MAFSLFPDLADTRFVEVNLDEQARIRQKRTPRLESPKKNNPFLDPAVCDRFVGEVAREFAADYTYGGYLEDRRFLWNTSYLDTTGSYLHLGVDFNVPQHTKVAALFSGKVVRIDDDYDLEGGWGPRIILQPNPIDGRRMPYAIFAHLFSPQVRVGDNVGENTILATVGGAPYNGNWFPHLHIQTVEADLFHTLLRDDLRSLDGYGHERDRDQLLSNFPNPLECPWLVGSGFCRK